MTKNPIINAIAAEIYIAIVASVMFYGPKIAGLADTPDTIIMPIAMISLFTLSAAMMGYIFLSQPLQLYLANEKGAAVNLFVKTLMTFAIITIIIFGLMVFAS